eukprot:UC1_evm1s1959
MATSATTVGVGASPTPEAVAASAAALSAVASSRHATVPAAGFDGEHVRVLEPSNSVREIHTILHDVTTDTPEFVFQAHRLIRLVVESGLERMPVSAMDVTTPTDQVYSGLSFDEKICAAVIMRSGEAVERVLRECYLGIRCGHILIQHEPETMEAKLYYARFPPDVAERRVLLLDPIVNSGATVTKALSVLADHGVDLSKVTLLNLIATSAGLRTIVDAYPHIHILSSHIADEYIDIDFSNRYFGT